MIISVIISLTLLQKETILLYIYNIVTELLIFIYLLDYFEILNYF